jgi:Phage minor capsid protein 2
MKLPTDPKVDALVRLYATAEIRLQGMIEAAVVRGAGGTARYYTQQLTSVRTLLNELQATATPIAVELVGQGYVLGALTAERALGVSGTFAGVHAQAVDVLADNMAARLNEAAATVGRRAEDVFRRQALRDTALGLIEGSTRKQVSQSLTRNLAKQGVTAFTDRGGRRWGLESYAKMVARTTTREAVSHGTANRMLENGHDLVTISEHSHDHDECSDYEGNTYSLTGATPGYDVLDTYPPFHPNCVHVLTPAAATLEQFERALAPAGRAAEGAVAVG